MLADLIRPGEQAWDACARTFLKQASTALAAAGYGLTAAFEPEFTLGRRGPAPTARRTAWCPSTTACATRRLVPRSWSSAYTCYGMDNREAAVRICSPLHGDAASSVNLELKPSDSSASPYLALGAFSYAGPDGIQRKLDPGEAVNVDPTALTEKQRNARDSRRLPDSLGAALEALAADEFLMVVLGPLRRTRLPRGQDVGGDGVRGTRRGLGVLPALHQVLSEVWRPKPPTCTGFRDNEPGHNGRLTSPIRYRCRNDAARRTPNRTGRPG